MTRRIVLAACFVLALIVALQVVAIHTHSLTGDGAYHLLAGHQALRYGQNTVNLEHPPLVKLLVALPLLVEDEPLTGPVGVREALARSSSIHQQPELLWRATVRGRYLEFLLLALPFLVACFALGRRFGGAVAGALLVAMLGLSSSVLPYLTILQTDTAVSLAFVLTVLAGLRYGERPGWRRAVELGLAAGFGLAVKFSAVLLGPTVLISLLLGTRTRRDVWHRVRDLAITGLVVLGVLHTVLVAANLDYDPSLGRQVITDYCNGQATVVVEDLMQPWKEPLLALERVDPYLAQWFTGFLSVHSQNVIGVYPSTVFGRVSSQGRWWYFPVVLLIKTPLVLLILAMVAGLWLRSRDHPAPSRRSREAVWLLFATAAVYLLAAVTSNYNLGVRHLLPIMPLLFLPLAVWLARRPRAATLVVTLLAVEAFALTPAWMSQTNTWWLGDKNPTRFSLSSADLEFRQSFVQLAHWADEHEVEGLKVLYPTLGEPVIRMYLPDARLVEPGDPLEPGWYAVSVTVEQLVPALIVAEEGDVWQGADLRHAAERWRPFWQAVVARGEDQGWVAGTFHIYWLPPSDPSP